MAITDPTDITGCVLWLDAGTISSLTDGQAVTSWADQSGNANDAVDGATSPVYDDGSAYFHGEPGVRFNNADAARMTVAADASLANANGTWIVVASLMGLPETNSDRSQFLLNKDNTNPATYGIATNTGSSPGRYTAMMRRDGNEASADFAVQEGWMDISTLTHIGHYDGSTYSYYINGDLASQSSLSGTIDTDNNGVLAIGNHPTADVAFRGVIHQVIYYDNAISSADRQDLEAWARGKFAQSFTNEGALFSSGLKGVSVFVDGSTAYLAYVKSDDVTIAYKTASTSNPHSWTDQGDIFTASLSTRGISLKKYSGTWYLYYDDRDNGGINLATGADLGSLSNVAGNPVITGTGSVGDTNRYVRHPNVLTPDETHDGNWYMLIDGRQDTPVGEDGAVWRYDGTDAETWSAGEEIISPGSARQPDHTDAGAPSAILIDGTYQIAYAGYNEDYEDATTNDGFPHWILFATSSDLTAANTSKRSNRDTTVPWLNGINDYCNGGLVQPELYNPGDGTLYCYNVGHEFVSSTSNTKQIGYASGNEIAGTTVGGGFRSLIAGGLVISPA